MDTLIEERAVAEGVKYLFIDEIRKVHSGRASIETENREHRIGKLLSKSRKIKEIKDYLLILECFQQEKVLQTISCR